MASSPEAPSGSSSSSSSEDEFDLGGSSLKSSGDAPASSKSVDAAARVSDDGNEEKQEADDDNLEGDDRRGVQPVLKKEAVLSEKDKEMEDLFGSDYDSGEEEFKASYVRSTVCRSSRRWWSTKLYWL